MSLDSILPVKKHSIVVLILFIIIELEQKKFKRKGYHIYIKVQRKSSSQITQQGNKIDQYKTAAKLQGKNKSSRSLKEYKVKLEPREE